MLDVEHAPAAPPRTDAPEPPPPARRARVRTWLHGFRPHQALTRPLDGARMLVGSLAGILVVGVVSRAALGPADGLPLLVAPMGASAVLLFALPASPLAQPWPTVGGCVVSALAGIASAQLLGDGMAAAAVAVAVAIVAMAWLRCLHPPGGAVALTAVLGGPAVLDAGWSFAAAPVGVNAVLIVGMALLFNNATGHTYPHVVHVGAAAAPEPLLQVTEEDVDRALAEYGERLDVDREDVVAVLEAATAHARRRAGG